MAKLPIDRDRFDELRKQGEGMIEAKRICQKEALLNYTKRARTFQDVQLLADILETIIELKF